MHSCESYICVSPNLPIHSIHFPRLGVRTFALYICVCISALQIRSSILFFYGLPWWLSGGESACQCRRCQFDPWVGKIPWRRKWLPTPLFLPGEFHGQRSLAGYSPWDHKELDTTEQLTHTRHPSTDDSKLVCRDGARS